MNEPKIGLEIHARLLTKTKMFCSCENRFGEKPNTLVCPICLGLPGVLPNINKRAVELGIITAKLLNCEIDNTLYFDRKNYRYPDLPKGYQITQRRHPLGVNGQFCGVRIREIHIEEDAGKLSHDRNRNVSLVDYNRAGTPLVEIVTEPDLVSGEQVQQFLKSLRDMLLENEISDCKMQEGSLRFDVNVSCGSNKTEIKNINSFKFARIAVNYEIDRQREIIASGKEVESETRGYDEKSKSTFKMRSKESNEDYLYIEEPDVIPIDISSCL